VDGAFRLGSWLVQPSLNAISRNGTTVQLEPKVMSVLVCLAEHPGETVSKEQLLQKVWPDTFVGDGVLTRSIFELRRVFEDDAKEPHVIQTIAKRGFRLLAPVTAASGHGTLPEPQLPDGVREKGGTSVRGWTWKLAIAGSAILFIASPVIFNVGSLRERVWARTSVPQIHSLAVLPLKNLSEDPTQEYFADGMTDELITYLAQISELRVISYTSTYRYKNTKKTLPEIARELGVDAIVEGSVQRTGGRVRVNAQLVYAPQERHLWAQSYDRDLLDSLAVQNAVAEAITNQIKVKLTPAQQPRLQVPRPVNLSALDAYLRGIDHLGRVGHGFGGEEVRKAVESLQEAVTHDPGFAMAYVKLAEAYTNEAFPYPLESLPLQKEAIEKAISLAPNSSAAHTARGCIRFTRDWDWPGAEAEYRHALDLNSNDSLAHLSLAEYFEAMGRLEEGMQERQRAQDLEPAIDDISVGLFRARQFETGIQLLKKRLDVMPNDGDLHHELSTFYAYAGMQTNSITELQRALALFGFAEAAGHIRGAFTIAGYRGALQTLAKEMEQAYAQGQVDRPDLVAETYTRLGDKDKAFLWLLKAYQERNRAMAFLQVEPFWDSLRSDPRFKDLIRRVGLPQ
jgi:TolB-like protein/DNA-binding winged helix-turn-helix (wHTH) protein